MPGGVKYRADHGSFTLVYVADDEDTEEPTVPERIFDYCQACGGYHGVHRLGCPVAK